MKYFTHLSSSFAFLKINSFLLCSWTKNPESGNVCVVFLLTMIEKGIEMSQINVQKTNEDFAVPWLVSLDMLKSKDQFLK